MNIKQLEYFVTAAENQNFTATAKKFYISQTAITQQIKSLENQVGELLFDRTKGKLSLTPAGYAFYQECKGILIRLSDALEKTHSAANGSTGSLRIGFIAGYEKTNFTELIKKFRSLYPNVALTFTRKNSKDLWRLLENDDVDLIFGIPSESIDEVKYSKIPIRKYPIMIVLYPSHPLSAHASIRLSELNNENFIILSFDETDNRFHNSIVQCINRKNIKPNTIQYSNNVDTILLMVSAGMGISLIPQFALLFYNQSQNLTIKPTLPEDNLSATIYAMWNNQNKNSAISNFLGCIS